MGNIISYLGEFGHLSFEELPFNEVDALILSQFAYLKLEGLVPKITESQKEVSLQEIKNNMQDKVVFSDERYEKDNRLLFSGMINSKRFSEMSCNYYADIIDENVETQFCAITCFFPDMCPVLVYRGTDENFVGWKEDFNMAFQEPVPGQNLAVLYLNQVGRRIDGEFIVCGHSKGGNFAVYGSMNAFTEIQKRIRRIYSFDGPGFRPEILNSEDYDKIVERIEKYIPRFSLVGMILESHEDYVVVECSSIGLLQHNPYTWKVTDDAFIQEKEVYKGQQFMNETLNEWILRLDEEQLEVFSDTLFYVLEGCEMKNLVEISQDWKTSVNNMLHASKEVPEEAREKIHEIMNVLRDVVKENIKDTWKETVKDGLKENWIETLKKR